MPAVDKRHRRLTIGDFLCEYTGACTCERGEGTDHLPLCGWVPLMSIETAVSEGHIAPSLPGTLVRDKTADHIRASGQTPRMTTADPAQRYSYLHTKLREELDEYIASGDPGELVDLIEVCCAAAALHGVTKLELLALIREKYHTHGDFSQWCVWLGNQS